MLNPRRHLLALLLALAVVAASCGDDTEEGGGGQQTGQKPRPTFPAGTTMANIQSKGKLVVGTKYDQPGFGQQNPTTGKVEGFDVEIAKLVAVAIFGGDLNTVEGSVQFVEAVSKNREPFIQNGQVDVVVATYTISAARKQVVDFAGPYFVAKQDMMVKADDTAIRGVADLNGKRTCTVKGSTSEQNLRAKAPQSDVLLFDTYSQCAEALRDGRVQAVTTDDTILAGLVTASERAFTLVGAPFSEEPYGIGLKKGDEAFRTFLNDRLEETYRTGEWAGAFASTLGRIGLKSDPPRVDRYASTAATPAATGATTSTTSAPTTSTTAGNTTTTIRY
jgi:glutamate transport system substrate-binding protein